MDGVRITTLGVVQDETRREPSHALFEIAMNPGTALPTEFPFSSLVVHVQQGEIQVVTEGGLARLAIGRGEPIRHDRDREVHARGTVIDLESGQAAVLGPGNAFSLADGSMKLEAIGRQSAVIVVSVLLPFDDDRCWICPWANPWPPEG